MGTGLTHFAKEAANLYFKGIIEILMKAAHGCFFTWIKKGMAVPVDSPVPEFRRPI